MASLPYMQLYVSDYLADTAHLSAEQHGAYMLLLMNYWQKGKPLDNTNDRLKHVARLSDDAWASNKEILAEFFLIEGEIWTHPRIEEDLAKVREKSVKASTAGKRSFSVRLTSVEQPFNHKDKDKDKDKEKDDEPNGSTIAELVKLYFDNLKTDGMKPSGGMVAGQIQGALKQVTVDRLRKMIPIVALAGMPLTPNTLMVAESRSKLPEAKPTWVPPAFDHAEEENRKARAVAPPQELKELFKRIP
jgi:uncharacterized protein YdaU (DUF1376 family)